MLWLNKLKHDPMKLIIEFELKTRLTIFQEPLPIEKTDRIGSCPDRQHFSGQQAQYIGLDTLNRNDCTKCRCL